MKIRLFRTIILAFTLFALIASILILNQKTDRERFESYLHETGKQVKPPEEKEGRKSPDQPQMAAFQDYLQTLDQVEKRVPVERLHRAYREIRQAEREQRSMKSTAPLQWEIVPSNMGGRTRVVMFDPNSSSGNKVWAGAVTGGLWYNDNIANPQSAWVPISDFWPSLAISSITYDPNNTDIFYAGTGEAFTARVIYRESSGVGAGIFKSTDGGQTWDQIPSTSGWKYVTDIEVRNENGSSVIYAGVASGEYHGTQQSEPTDGLYRSTDGGSTWTQVMPLIENSSDPYAVADIEITAGNRILVGSMANLKREGGATILYSDLGTGGSWTIYDNYKNIIESSSDMNIPNRVMIAGAPSDPDVAYALLDAGYINADDGFTYTQGLYILRSDNAGAGWTSKPIPSGGQYYWATIGWHALTVGVDPNNADALYIGGLDTYKSTTGGNSWTQVSEWYYMYYGGGDRYVHADIHDIDYKPGSSDELIISTDGGVFYTDEAQLIEPPFQEMNQGYGSLQFYTCALHPLAGSVKYAGGLQDNGSLYHTGNPLTINDMITGGDGAYCFIDQTQPQWMITSVYYNQYTLFNNGNQYEYMSGWSSGTFISPADYDDKLNILYANACSFGGEQANQLLRIQGIPNNISGTFLNLGTGLSVYYTAVECSPHSPAGTTTLFVGSLDGRLFKAMNAQAIPQVSEITGADFPLGAISSVAIGGSEDTLLATFSNYGVASVWQSYDGGLSWINKEANLPDIPVRWALYHPYSSKYAMLATELGVWTTSSLDQEETTWVQDIEGLANVRVDMLQMRTSDNTVLAATHGRGLATVVWDIQTGLNEPGKGEEEKGEDVTVFPNPGRGRYSLQFTVYNLKSVRVEIADLNGKILGSYNNRTMEQWNNGTLEQWNSGTLELNISPFPAGIYFLRIHLEDKIIVKKIIKQ